MLFALEVMGLEVEFVGLRALVLPVEVELAGEFWGALFLVTSSLNDW